MARNLADEPPFMILKTYDYHFVKGLLDQYCVAKRELEGVTHLIDDEISSDEEFESKRKNIKTSYTIKLQDLSEKIRDMDFILKRIEVVEQLEKLEKNLNSEKLTTTIPNTLYDCMALVEHTQSLLTEHETKKQEELTSVVNAIEQLRNLGHPEIKLLDQKKNGVQKLLEVKMQDIRELLEKSTIRELRLSLKPYVELMKELSAEFVIFPLDLVSLRLKEKDLVSKCLTITDKVPSLLQQVQATVCQTDVGKIKQTELLQSSQERFSSFQAKKLLWAAKLKDRMNVLSLQQKIERVNSRIIVNPTATVLARNIVAASTRPSRQSVRVDQQQPQVPQMRGTTPQPGTTRRVMRGTSPAMPGTSRQSVRVDQQQPQVPQMRGTTPQPGTTRRVMRGTSPAMPGTSIWTAMEEDDHLDPGCSVVLEKLLICEICKYYTTRPIEMAHHKETHHKSGTEPVSTSGTVGRFKCTQCSVILQQPELLKWHHMNCHDDSASVQVLAQVGKQCYKCCLCNEVVKFHEDIVKHLKCNHKFEKLPFKCPVCKKGFTTKYRVEKHHNFCKTQKEKVSLVKRSKLFNGPHSCKFCEVNHETKKDLERHVKKIHLKKKTTNIKCRYCPQSFPSNTQLFEHSKTKHPGKIVVKCAICKMGYCTASGLSEHKKFAHQRYKFLCEKCPSYFERPARLRWHYKTVHSEEVWVCKFCSASLPSKSYLTTHIKNTHVGNFFHCEFCNHATRVKGALADHIRRLHLELI